MRVVEESKRLAEDRHGIRPWKKWGPYLSERQWGTVREDYSEGGNAWSFITHERARSNAYRWGEEGIAGISDDQQKICFSLGFWNYKDPILKERLFGLNGHEGNHGEDVKEYYYYLDSTPTHSYMKMLYKYPQKRFPYEDLVETNQALGRLDEEYELIDTGIFADDKYFDIFIEYAKLADEDILIRVVIYNRGDEYAKLKVLPTVWFRNTWQSGHDTYKPRLISYHPGIIDVVHKDFDPLSLYVDATAELLFCDNETHHEKVYGGKVNEGPFKDGINDYVVDGDKTAVHQGKRQAGTKAAASYAIEVAAGGKIELRFRLGPSGIPDPFGNFSYIFDQRIKEADEYYEQIQVGIKDKDALNVQRQAYAGMLWNKQFYYYDVSQWLLGDPNSPEPPRSRMDVRNHDWTHLRNADIISMPDKWEYPWYAAWDLAFHCLPLAHVDAEFAKHQLLLLTKERYMHPNGQLPAYEWNFSDVNPPVHAWATWRVFEMEKQRTGTGDTAFLEKVFLKLMLNFTWWVNRKDEAGNNIFQGGFLGLDNIGVFDRSAQLPTGGHIEQSDGTSWMAMYSLNMLRMALELAKGNPNYQEIAIKFFEHFLYIAGAMTNIGDQGINLWDEEDQFFYDVLNLPDAEKVQLKVRSMVGLIPLYAVEVLELDLLASMPEFTAHMEHFLQERPDLAKLVSRWKEPGQKDMHMVSMLRGHRMTKILKRMLDEDEFLSPYGIRALSRYHEDNPYVFDWKGTSFSVKYLPAESDSGFFGGNSNWRGPVWFPVNYLLIESLYKFHSYYGEKFRIEYPTGSGAELSLREIAGELTERLTRIFLKDAKGHRAVFGDNKKMQEDPHFKDYILFYEYFHGDNGRGVGASHQAGWTGLIANLLREHGAEPESLASDRLGIWNTK